MDPWKLANVEERADRSPETFWIPPRALRERVQVGDVAKLIFEEQGSGERMWVEVLDILEGPRFRGRLLSQAAVVSVTRGSIVEFGPENIADVGRTGPEGEP